MNQSQPRPNKDFSIDYDLMNFINDAVKSAIEDTVQNTVDKELLLMVNGEGFKKRTEALIDARLHSLVEGIAIRTNGAGPGRGHVGKSASENQPEPSRDPLYQQARELQRILQLSRCFCPGTILEAPKRVGTILLTGYGWFPGHKMSPGCSKG